MMIDMIIYYLEIVKDICDSNSVKLKKVMTLCESKITWNPIKQVCVTKCNWKDRAYYLV